jgi:hypothetical protein
VTHISRRAFRRAGIIMASTLGALALAAGAASASTPSPSPSPSVSPFVTLPFGAQTFIVHSNTAGPAGTVAAFGRINGTGVGNFAPGPDPWVLTGPASTLRVFHTSLAPLVVDLRSCTASAVTTGRWALVGRSGIRRVFGFGTYSATEVAALARGLFGRCLGLSRPARWDDVQVLATGRVERLRLFGPFPVLSPRLTPVS